MIESNLMKLVQLAVGKLSHVKLFRNNTGMGWTGDARSVKGSPTDKMILNARPLHAGLCEGSSDLIGWTTIEIKPEHVGRKIAVFTAIEVKTDTGKATQKQRNFLEQVAANGGFALLCKTPEAAQTFIEYHSK